MKKLNGGVCALEDVLASGLHAGFKQQKKDLGLLYFPKGVKVAGVFTKNAIQSHHIKYDQALLRQNHSFKAILTNSGNANTCNGVVGDETVLQMVNTLARTLKIQADEVLVCSTGVIGVPMNLNDFDKKCARLVCQLTKEDSLSAVEAMMTTDTFAKQLAYEFKVGNKTVKIAGITKGAGMIHPNLGTMLAYLVTDADFEQAQLHSLLKDVVGDSFNCLTVDGDTSPNDTVFLASTGKVKITWNDETLTGFYRGLLELSQELTRLMAKDGEGATKFVEVIVKCAQTHADALKIAKGVATSNLVKTALYGQDANWGRIISAIGQSQPEYLQADKIAIAFESEAGYVQVCKHGVGLPFDETQALAVMSEQSVTIIIDLGLGVSNSKVWTCDMSLDYIKINADYRS